MKKNEKIILVGGFPETIELCKACGKKILGIIDNDPKKNLYGFKRLGNDRDAPKIFIKHRNTPIVISPDSPLKKEKLVEYYSKIGFRFCSLIHPKANISKYARLGKGVIIQNYANISSNVTVEDFVKINSYANIMHDALIQKYSTVAPNAVVLGGVKISEMCFIGANSTILPNIIIHSYSVVGAGAIVTKTVKKSNTVIGVAAKKLK